MKPFFNSWFLSMEDFKQEQELKRMIFGLSAIIKTVESQIPPIVNQKLPEIMN